MRLTQMVFFALLGASLALGATGCGDSSGSVGGEELGDCGSVEKRSSSVICGSCRISVALSCGDAGSEKCEPQSKAFDACIKKCGCADRDQECTVPCWKGCDTEHLAELNCWKESCAGDRTCLQPQAAD